MHPMPAIIPNTATTTATVRVVPRITTSSRVNNRVNNNRSNRVVCNAMSVSASEAISHGILFVSIIYSTHTWNYHRNIRLKSEKNNLKNKK